VKLQSAQQTLQGAERIHQIESARQWADELKEGTQTLGRRFWLAEKHRPSQVQVVSI